jgi:hypothetical protein
VTDIDVDPDHANQAEKQGVPCISSDKTGPSVTEITPAPTVQRGFIPDKERIMTRSCVVAAKTIAGAVVAGALLIAGAPAFATVVAGDLSPASPPQYINLGGNALIAQPFTLGSASKVNQVDLAWWSTNDSPRTDTITVYIADGLGSGSHNLLTLHESFTVPLGIVENRPSYSFSPVDLPAGTYYLILGSSGAGELSWNQNSPGSTEVGTLGTPRYKSGTEFGPGWHEEPCEKAVTRPELGCITNNTMSFALEFVQRLVPTTPIGVGPGQIIHLTVYAGPVTVPPGVPVEATVGFVDADGRSLGNSTQVSLGAGQTTSVDLNADSFINQGARRIEVLPVFSVIADPAMPSLGASVEVVDTNTGFATVLAPARTVTSLPAALDFAPQGLAGGQTLRLNVAAAPSGTCTCVLSFVNGSGASVGQSLPVNLASGTTASLSVTARSLGLGRGQRTDLRPMISAATNCLGSAEVFDDLTGRTSTYQTASGQ